MALTVSTLIDEVRDLTGPVSVETLPNNVIVRALARAEREIYEAVVLINEEVLAINTTFNASQISTALDNASPLTMPAHYMLLDGTLSYADDEVPPQPFFFIPVKQKEEMLDIYPSGYLLGGTSLYLRKRDPRHDHDEWYDADTLTISYVPVPTTPTSLNGTFTAPDICARYMILKAACDVRKKLGTADKDLIAEAAAAKGSLITTLGNQDSAEISRVRVIFD